jgi:hypothetical protein
MISWEDAQNYPLCDEQDNFNDFRDCVKKFLVEKTSNSAAHATKIGNTGFPLWSMKGNCMLFLYQ